MFETESWTLAMIRSSKITKFREGKDNLRRIPFFASEILDPQTENSDKLALRYSAVLTKGDTVASNVVLEILKDTSGIEKQNISLMLFVVNNAEVSADDKATIREFAKNLSENDSITIVGYTDRLGQFEDNLRLSVQRARNIAIYLKSILSIEVRAISVDGVGSMKMPPQISSYSTPEERFLSRTVRIEVFRRVAKN
jgi:outer membrane protein OmpA-like peptidoglycan-associated protein